MNYIAIDTSGDHLTVVAVKDGKTYTFFDRDCKTHHSERLMEETEKLCLKAGFKPKDADFFAVVTGAGSFTGIRIGLATVKAMCYAHKKPCLSITSFDTIAYNKDSGKVLSLIDAGHGGYYICGYEDGKVTVSPSYVLKKDLEKYRDYRFLAAEGANIDGAEEVSVVTGLMRAAELKKDTATCDLEKVNPLYVRKSQAEEGR